MDRPQRRVSSAPYSMCDLGFGLPRPARLPKLSWDLPWGPPGTCGFLAAGSSGTSCGAISKHGLAPVDVNALVLVSLRQKEDEDRVKWAKVWISLVWHFQQERGFFVTVSGELRACQGHHVCHEAGKSVRQYSRDDVLPQLDCQRKVLRRICAGWVPVTVSQRGVARTAADLDWTDVAGMGVLVIMTRRVSLLRRVRIRNPTEALAVHRRQARKIASAAWMRLRSWNLLDRGC